MADTNALQVADTDTFTVIDKAIFVVVDTFSVVQDIVDRYPKADNDSVLSDTIRLDTSEATDTSADTLPARSHCYRYICNSATDTDTGTDTDTDTAAITICNRCSQRTPWLTG